MTGRRPGDNLHIVFVFSTHAESALMFTHVVYVVAKQAFYSI